MAEFEYRGTVPGTGEPFAIPNIFVMRVRDGRIVESRDYADHVEIARVLGGLDDLVGAARQRTGGPADGGDWRDRARQRYEDAVFGDDAEALAQCVRGRRLAS